MRGEPADQILLYIIPDRRNQMSRSGKKNTGASGGGRRRNRTRIIAAVIALLLVATLVLSLFVSAVASQTSTSRRTVKEGITLNGTDLSGMTKDEVQETAEALFASMKSAVITLRGSSDEQTVSVTAGNLGLTWTNEDVVDEIVSYGHAANIIARYKQEKDLEVNGASFELETDFNTSQIQAFITNNCSSWSEPAVEPSMTRSSSGFVYTEGSDGVIIDEEASLNRIYSYLTTQWDGNDVTIDLEIELDEPSTTVEDLQQLTSVLGTYTTSYSTSNTARSANIANACAMINGLTLEPGESFSTLNTITPFTEENGYQLAGSYVGNEVVDSFGGGICQVSTTLYNAVIRAELNVTMRYCHSMSVSYVALSADAAIAESTGMDFRFTNNLSYPIYIEGSTGGGYITFTIYGVETRDSGRKVSFESETLTETPSEGITVKEDASLAVGTVEVTSGYTGYTAQLWKVVTVNGVEESREVFNKSTYNMTPTTVTVGTAGTVTDELRAAMESGDLETIRTAAANAAAGVDNSAIDTDELTAKAQAAADAAYAEALAQGLDTTTALEKAQEAANAVVEAATSGSSASSSADATQMSDASADVDSVDESDAAESVSSEETPTYQEETAEQAVESSESEEVYQ